MSVDDFSDRMAKLWANHPLPWRFEESPMLVLDKNGECVCETMNEKEIDNMKALVDFVNWQATPGH